MRVDNLTQEQQSDIGRRLERGFGEYVNVPVVADDGTVDNVTYYVGKMNMGQTGQIIPVLLKVFTNLQSVQGDVDLVALAQGLDEDTLASLLAVILEEKDKQFVIDNYDIVWVIDVLVAFFKHNDFLTILNKVTSLVQPQTQEAQATSATVYTPTVTVTDEA